jgi:hypothetical protein
VLVELSVEEVTGVDESHIELEVELGKKLVGLGDGLATESVLLEDGFDEEPEEVHEEVDELDNESEDNVGDESKDESLE